MLWLILLTQLSTLAGCDSRGGYFKSAGRVCLLPADMDEAQELLFADLIANEGELASALSDQQRFTVAKVATQVAALGARIAFLEAKRDSTDGRPARTYQARIDKIERDREALIVKRDETVNLDSVVSRLSREIDQLKRDLNASIRASTQ